MLLEFIQSVLTKKLAWLYQAIFLVSFWFSSLLGRTWELWDIYYVVVFAFATI